MSPIEKPDLPETIEYHLSNHHHRHHQRYRSSQSHHQTQQQQQQQEQIQSITDNQQNSCCDLQKNIDNHSRRQTISSISTTTTASVSSRLNNHHVISIGEIHQKLNNNDNENLINSNNNNNNNNNLNANSNLNSNSNDIKNCENFNKNYLNNHLCEQIDDLPKYNRNRQLFGIQLEVTSLLLEAERRKLAVLQRELQAALEDSGSIKKAKEQLKQELILAISRIQLQYDLLEKEYRQHAIGRLRSSNTRGVGKSNRSQPAIGLKQTPKSRPTIFGTVASDQCPKDNTNRKGFPQTTTTNGNSTRTSEKSHSAKNIHQSTSSSSSSKQATNNTSISGSVAPSTNNQQIQSNSPAHQQRGEKQQHNQNHNKCHHQESADENALVYRDGNLISGPLDTLIQHMVPTADYYPDRSYLFAFLLSARLFIRPHELLARICQLCEEQQDLTGCRCCAGSGLGGDDIVDFSRHHSHHHSHASSLHHNSDASIVAGNAKPSISTSSMVGGEIECCGKLRQFSQNFVRLLAEWIDTFPYDFRDERLMQHVRSMTRKCIAIDSSLRKDVQTMLQNLLQRLTVLEKYEEFLLTLSQNGVHNSENNVDGPKSQDSIATTVTAAANSKSSSVLTIQNNLHAGGSITDSAVGGQPIGGNATAAAAATGSGPNHLVNASSSVDISELCSSPSLLAHQLTHIELERLSYIGPEEFVQAFAKENPHLEQSFSDMKKTRNLESYVQWFNRLSYLVATEIVKHPKKKQRVRIVEYWIETGRECFNIGNFNSLMAIIAGLNMSPISRLKKTWAKVQTAKFSVLEHQMDPSSNFNSYRSTLKAAMWRSAGATDERERIVIPFFSLLVKDLYFLNEGCSNKLSNGHINFEKFWQLAKQVTEFIAWKQVTCPFEKLPKVIMFLQTNHILNENTLAIASFECEPPENNHEKDRFKSLKSEQQQHSLNHHHQCQ